MDKKINISSSTIEKGIDLVKDFVDKLISPAIEETGLLIRDKAKVWRFNNQLNMLAKTKSKCDKHNISTKVISFKVLFPLLEYAGLEDDEVMQEKWANLLSNMVDSEQNIDNHVFPYILSQISLSEYKLLNEGYNSNIIHKGKIKEELRAFLLYKVPKSKEIKMQIKDRINNNHNGKVSFETSKDTYLRELRHSLTALELKERELKEFLSQEEIFLPFKLKDYEIANLTRLGLVKSVIEYNGYIDNYTIENDTMFSSLYLIDVPVKINNKQESIIMTELGEKFIQACSEKTS